MYFELKVFDLVKKSKTKIQLNAGTPFSADSDPEIFKSGFTPQRVRKLLHFIADDLIIRLVIKANPDGIFLKLFNEQNAIRNGKSLTKTKYSTEQQEALDVIEAKMIKKAKEYLEKNPGFEINLTQFNFEELSPALLAESLQTIVNNNVPPPKTKDSLRG